MNGEREREILMNLLDNISKKNGFEILKGQLQGGQERGKKTLPAFALRLIHQTNSSYDLSDRLLKILGLKIFSKSIWKI